MVQLIFLKKEQKKIIMQTYKKTRNFFFIRKIILHNLLHNLENSVFLKNWFHQDWICVLVLQISAYSLTEEFKIYIIY